MKHSLILIAIPVFLVFASCNNNKPVEQTYTPPPPKIYSHDQQNKVFSDINFGINEKTYNKLYKAYAKRKKCDYGCNVGEFSFEKPIPQFSDNKLYFLELSHFIGAYERYDESVPVVVGYALNVVKAEYGPPDVIKPIPNWPSVENLSGYLIYKWLIGDKTIEIQVSQISRMYYVTLFIYQKSISDQVEKDKARIDSLKQDSIMKKDKGTL